MRKKKQNQTVIMMETFPHIRPQSMHLNQSGKQTQRNKNTQLKFRPRST